MLLSKLLENLDYIVASGDANVEVNNLIYDSRKVSHGDVFVCIVGAKSDGHVYIEDVVKKGAKAIIIQRELEDYSGYPDVTFILTKDTRLALAYMSAAFFDYPAKKLKTIGITGTKGKTTTTFMIRDILEKCNIRTGLIGTVETIIGDTHIKSVNTTPESYLVQEYFHRMVEAGCECVVMEVSSQALMLHRTAGILFDLGVFTNLEPDHIGPNEHKDFEDYLNCKAKLFSQCKIGIGNRDSEHFDEVMKNRSCSLESYGIHSDADLVATNIEYIMEDGNIMTRYDLVGARNMKVKLNIPGEFSVYNSLCAISVASHFDVPQEVLLEALWQSKAPGRVEPVNVSDEYSVMIDFAHNTMSLESLLTTLRAYHPKRLVTLFGCIGGRAQIRREGMGDVSGRLSDFTIITSDNPYDEDPELIMKDIEKGVSKYTDQYVMIADRREAVRYAIAHALPGDLIVLAGKGHEDYQEIKGVKYPQTDRGLVYEAIEAIARS